jgi:hypothetical protein
LTNTIEDTHFYFDNAPPKEVMNVISILSVDYEQTPKEIASSLSSTFAFEMQKDHTYSPRRVHDLGLAIRVRRGTSVKYKLNDLGLKIQNLLGFDRGLSKDLLHYLHYTGYKEEPKQRKYLWSYRKCCEIIWSNMRFVRGKEMASSIQAEMRDQFDWLDYGKKTGARFNDTAVNQIYSWLKNLDPSPFETIGDELKPRKIDRYEIALLSLNEIYNCSGYTFGDPVIMDDNFIQRVSGVFMLDFECCKQLIEIGARLNNSVKLAETLTGISVTLKKPFNIDNI